MAEDYIIEIKYTSLSADQKRKVRIWYDRDITAEEKTYMYGFKNGEVDYAM